MYIVDPSADEPIMLIDRHIGDDPEDGRGVIGSDFVQELMYLDGLGKKRIKVWINSTGGSVMDGYAIYNAILQSKTKVDTYCVGMAASIAGVIFQAGRKRVMMDYGVLMYHNPFSSSTDESANKAVEAMRNSIVKMIAGRCGKNEDEVAAIMDRETYVSAAEAFATGLCDEIEASGDYNKKRITAVPSDAKAFVRQAATVYNSILQKPVINMNKVTNRLKLNQSANEDAVVEAIDQIENRATTATARVKELETALDKERTDKEAAIKERDEAKTALDEVKNSAVREKASARVDKAVEEGRIEDKSEVKNLWIEKLVEDYDVTDAMLVSIPVTRKAKEIPAGQNNGGGAGKVKNYAASILAQKKAELTAK